MANPYLGKPGVSITRAEVRQARKWLASDNYPAEGTPDHDVMLRFWATHNARCRAKRYRRENLQAATFWVVLFGAGAAGYFLAPWFIAHACPFTVTPKTLMWVRVSRLVIEAAAVVTYAVRKIVHIVRED